MRKFNRYRAKFDTLANHRPMIRPVSESLKRRELITVERDQWRLRESG